MVKRTTLLKALGQACYSPALYWEIYQSWRYRIFALLALLCILIGFAGIIKPFDAMREFHSTGNQYLDQLPTLHFDNQGLMTINKTSPYLIKSATTGKLLIVFDIQADKAQLAHYPALLFSFGHTGFYVHNDATQAKPITQFTTYKAIAPLLKGLTLTPKQFISALSYLMVLVQIIIYGFSVIATFSTKALIGLLLAFFAMPVAFVYNIHTSLGQAFRIGIIALIPSSLLEFFYNCTSLPETGWLTLALSALSLSYVMWIIHNIKNTSKQSTDL